jgi:hypothetical protein
VLRVLGIGQVVFQILCRCIRQTGFARSNDAGHMRLLATTVGLADTIGLTKASYGARFLAMLQGNILAPMPQASGGQYNERALHRLTFKSLPL